MYSTIVELEKGESEKLGQTKTNYLTGAMGFVNLKTQLQSKTKIR